MNKSGRGEFQLIELINKTFSGLVPIGFEGIGDDCAIIPINPDESFVVTTDMLIEDVHFVRDRISSFELGGKSLAVSLSDVASMGAVPVASFLSFALPSEVSDSWRMDFIEGYKKLSDIYNAPLLGGDTTGSKDKITINVTLLGRVSHNNIKRRSGAVPGDKICVSGDLGDSAAGLKLLLCGHPIENRHEAELVTSHNNPYPYIREGIWLGGKNTVTSMMDVSDGIASDIRHIMDRSGVGAIIELDKIPLSKPLEEISAQYNWDKYRLAVAGGEDYVLLFTVSPEYFSDLRAEYKAEFGMDIYCIGTVTEPDNGLIWKRNDIVVNENFVGYRHF
ncbi:MAG: thiamine-phosphate kinase [Rikenellaceae bacterium]|nr:thiamine-phosphate kinase [Rikenellaceae bacterium]